jgi:hypothetical protein
VFTVGDKRYVADDEQAVGKHFAASTTSEHEPGIDAITEDPIFTMQPYTSSEQSRTARTTP